MSSDDALRYPIGKFAPQENYTPSEIEALISRIADLPAKLEKAAASLSSKQLETPYREGGWTARQVLHHVADSHMNAYIRFKWTLTENTPVIKAYDEKAWAQTEEVNADPAISLALLKALHIKWVELLKRLTPEELKREFVHPETQRHVRMDRMIATYAWHGEHHLGHVSIILSK